MAVKRITCLLAVLALLLAGCVAKPTPEESTAETTTVTQSQAETTEPPAIEEEWAEITPPLDYEVMYGFAKTPTHYYAEHEGGIIQAPIDNLAKQIRIPLPDKHEGVRLAGAEIIGVSKDWLFVTMRKYRTEKPSEFVAFRIAMESWKAEALTESSSMPWYNAASDSLLIPNGTLEAMPLSTRKQARILWENAPQEFPAGRGWEWWDNTIDGRAVLVECNSDSAEDYIYHVFDKQNQVQLKKYREVNLASAGLGKMKLRKILRKKICAQKRYGHT